MSIPRVIARCRVCATEVERDGSCPTCTSLARLRKVAVATGNLKGARAKWIKSKIKADMPLRGQDAALPPGDRQ